MKDWGLAKVTLNVADGSMKEDISSWLVFVVLVALSAVAVLAPGPVAAIAAIGGEVSGIAIAAVGGEVSGIAAAFAVVGRVISGNSASLSSTPLSLAHKL